MNCRLSKSPMQESVLHIRCDFSAIVAGAPDKVVSRFSELLSSEGLAYERPLLRPMAPRPLQDGSGAIILPPPEQRRCGERFRSADGLRVVQIFSDGVAISWLKPYDSWKSYTDFAFSVLKKLMDQLTGDVRVDRVGLRAINRLALPAGDESIAKLLVGRDLPQSIGDLRREGFLACDTLFDSTTGARANVTRTYEPNQDAQGVSLFFDIDAYYLPRRVIKHEELLREIEQLHDFRNRIFFAEISEQAKEVYK